MLVCFSLWVKQGALSSFAQIFFMTFLIGWSCLNNWQPRPLYHLSFTLWKCAMCQTLFMVVKSYIFVRFEIMLKILCNSYQHIKIDSDKYRSEHTGWSICYHFYDKVHNNVKGVCGCERKNIQMWCNSYCACFSLHAILTGTT